MREGLSLHAMKGDLTVQDDLTWNQWEQKIFTSKGKLSDIDDLRVAILGALTPEQYDEIKRETKGPPPAKKMRD